MSDAEPAVPKLKRTSAVRASLPDSISPAKDGSGSPASRTATLQRNASPFSPKISRNLKVEFEILKIFNGRFLLCFVPAAVTTTTPELQRVGTASAAESPAVRSGFFDFCFGFCFGVFIQQLMHCVLHGGIRFVFIV